MLLALLDNSTLFIFGTLSVLSVHSTVDHCVVSKQSSFEQIVKRGNDPKKTGEENATTVFRNSRNGLKSQTSWKTCDLMWKEREKRKK